MKILFLSEDFPPDSFGGGGLMAYHLAKELKSQGQAVFVITAINDKSKIGQADYEGLKVYRIYAPYHDRWRAWLSLNNPAAVKQVKKIMAEIRPDVVHAHNIHHHLSYHCLKIARQYARAVFLTAHDVMLIHYDKFIPRGDKYISRISVSQQIKEAKKRYNPWRNFRIRHYLKYIDKIFAVSQSLKEILALNGINNVATLYNGINVNDWQISREAVEKFKHKHNLLNQRVILFGGRLSNAKGGEQILEALALIKKKIDNPVLLVVGEKGSYAQKMQQLAKSSRLEENLVFTGWLAGGELKIAYQAAEICVFPSICFEAFGLVNLEAMACQKPTVSTFFGGPSEVVVDNQTGYLVNPKQAEVLAEKIIDLLEHPEKAKQFGRAGYQRAKEHFNLKDKAIELLKWYQKYV